MKQCPHEPFAPYLVIATPVNFLDGIFGYTSRLALHWYQICVVPFRAVKTGLSHGLNNKPSTYRPVNQLIALMGEMNQNIIHSKNNIGSTLLSNNAASDVSEWFLEWFWCCELLSRGGYSSMIWVGTCRWDLKSRPIFIPNFTEKWDPFLYQSHKF